MARPRPHPLATSPAARFANRAMAWMWEKGLTERPQLDPEFLWSIGSKGYCPEDEISIRSQEDVADFRDRLGKLCTSLREEAQLNALGHTMAYGQLVAAIRKRHQLGRHWLRHPEHASATIAPPIIVVGQMRAGTTRVQRLLAADPAHAGTRFCNSHNPAPRRPDLRPVRTRLGLAVARQINPWLDTLHPFGAARTDEEIGWLAAALDACAYEAQWQVPSFVAFNEAADPAPVYREFARILRTDAITMGDAERPRILKCPQFAEDLSPLLATFPDARLIVTERADNDVTASAVSMVAGQSAFQSDALDIETMETEWRRKLDLRSERMRNALSGFDGRVVKVRFQDLNRDWAHTMAEVYGALGLKLTEAALNAMEGEVEVSKSDPHHHHRTQISRFAEV